MFSLSSILAFQRKRKSKSKQTGKKILRRTDQGPSNSLQMNKKRLLHEMK